MFCNLADLGKVCKSNFACGVQESHNNAVKHSCCDISIGSLF